MLCHWKERKSITFDDVQAANSVKFHASLSRLRILCSMGPDLLLVSPFLPERETLRERLAQEEYDGIKKFTYEREMPKDSQSGNWVGNSLISVHSFLLVQLLGLRPVELLTPWPSKRLSGRGKLSQFTRPGKLEMKTLKFSIPGKV